MGKDSGYKAIQPLSWSGFVTSSALSGCEGDLEQVIQVNLSSPHWVSWSAHRYTMVAVTAQRGAMWLDASPAVRGTWVQKVVEWVPRELLPLKDGEKKIHIGIRNSNTLDSRFPSHSSSFPLWARAQRRIHSVTDIPGRVPRCPDQSGVLRWGPSKSLGI